MAFAMRQSTSSSWAIRGSRSPIQSGPNWKRLSPISAGLANATLLIHLTAASLGLAAQYVSDANSPYMETMLKVLLRIPEPLRVYHLVPIGYAKSRVAA